MLLLLLSKGQRPSQQEWWVVYTLEMQQNCCIYAIKKHMLASEEGWADLV